MQDFHKLDVRKRSHRLTLTVYHETACFPSREVYGLTSQIRRACYSVPSNIAEGCCRRSAKEFAQLLFLYIARGSSSELEYFLLLAHDLGLFDDASYHSLNNEAVGVKRMLASLIHRIDSTGHQH